MMSDMVTGYVVNIYDALNYDIDFPYVDKTQHKVLSQAIQNVYCYKNIMKCGAMSNELQGCSYRCRLNGIEMNAKTYNRRQIKMYTHDIKQWVDRVDGWVHCWIRGVDIYQRLLIDLYLPKVDVNLCDYLLLKLNDDHTVPFHKYHTNKAKYKRYYK